MNLALNKMGGKQQFKSFFPHFASEFQCCQSFCKHGKILSSSLRFEDDDEGRVDQPEADFGFKMGQTVHDDGQILMNPSKTKILFESPILEKIKSFLG